MLPKSDIFVADTTNFGKEELEIGKMYDCNLVILDPMRPDIDRHEASDSAIPTSTSMTAGLTLPVAAKW